MDRSFNQIISNESELREILGYPKELVTKKAINYIDENCQIFIENSPFINIATSDQHGNLDVSPKGDPSGFVKILNNKMLAIPDRPGNKRADTFTNILNNPNIGLIFLIPGVKESLRVNGTAQIVTDKEVLELLSCDGKLPLFAIIVTVKEAFMHCSKCMIRSKLWRGVEDTQDRIVPTLGKVLVDHAKLDIDYKKLDEEIEDDEKNNLY